MGMFDEVCVPCPDCGAEITFQSKGGECKLASYRLDDVPFDVLADVAGTRNAEHCRKCGTRVRLVVSFSVFAERVGGQGGSTARVWGREDES